MLVRYCFQMTWWYSCIYTSHTVWVWTYISSMLNLRHISLVKTNLPISVNTAHVAPALHSLKITVCPLWLWNLCYEIHSPLKHVWPQDFLITYFFFSVNTMPHFVSPNTQHTLFKHQRDGWKPSRAPCLLPWTATEEGSQTYLPSSASIASIVAEEKKRGVAKRMREVSRSSFRPRNKSMSSKDSQCRQQRLTSSPHFMTKDTWMLAKGREEEEEEGKERGGDEP